MTEALTPGRPRETRVDDAVAGAVRELLAADGYAGTTIARVASRAGVGRGALYRRWRSKAEMVFAAVVHGIVLDEPADTGDLEGDLAALAQRIAQLTSGPTARAALTGLSAEIAADPALGTTLDERLFAAERRYLAAILDRAVARGEIGAGADVELVRRLLVGSVAFVPTYTGAGPTPARDVARLIAAGLRTTKEPR